MNQEMDLKMKELKTARLKIIDGYRDPLNKGIESGLKKLLTELYPDKAHFIFELMQNAEDENASTVCFTLNADGLQFEHNSKKAFSYDEVKSITLIGDSPKRDDPTTIGKFGVGFKAVFAYTNTPEIHSGEFDFRIHDLMVPDIIQGAISEENKTIFIFPFDKQEKLPEKATEEIEHGLRSLNNNTLLFLSHIHKIEYRLPDGSIGSMERISYGENQIKIQVSSPEGNVTVSHWLHFQKTVEVADDEEKKTNHVKSLLPIASLKRRAKQILPRHGKSLLLMARYPSIFQPKRRHQNSIFMCMLLLPRRSHGIVYATANPTMNCATM